MSASGYLKLTRPATAAAAGLAAAAAFWITGGADITTAVLLFFSVAFICGAGSAVNDCFDADFDRIHRPARPIPRGDAAVSGGVKLAVLLFTAGFLCSLPILPWCPWLAAVNILLLIIYSTSFKRMPLLGNICIAYLAGSVFLFGGMAVGPESFILTAPLFQVAFFGTLSREIVKDAEEVEGDRDSGAYTLPMLIGIQPACITAFVCMTAAALFAFLPALQWGLSYAAWILAVDVWLLWSAAKAAGKTTSEEVSASKASRYMKIGMCAAILVVLLSAVLGRL